MIRTRMLWFSFGFASASATIAQFVYKDLLFDSNSIASQMKERFKSLDSRVSNLESAFSSKTDAPRVEETVG
ncbi:uncharacterized protein LOC142541390 [Primulina tabacum]|uniref:uncharacterized protein LOC142541390 n=1 Tax=Primulina tabacum TaxID=48773 RepID=UPI003F5A4FEC